MSLRDLELPDRVHPIVLIGAGGIARDAHLPAYKKAGFTVASIFDIDRGRARSLAEAFGITSVASTLEEAVRRAAKDAVFDIATPPTAFLGILQRLPEGAGVLMQKPMGETLAHALQIRNLCHSKK